ncbi:MAG: DUF3048 domain-containing protein [Clostridia bacterium]|nr:DUF3048 domain-containing protein [Clostridia bacterium]
MKRIISLILILSLVFIAGCKKEEVSKETVENPPVEIDENLPEYVTRPVAVMIDNDGPSSRPQKGLESAYMVYEILIEGGSTRTMAIFKDAPNMDKVGPIRSSRHYFLDFALEHDAIYCHSGWSPKAMNDIPKLNVNNVNGILGDDGKNFYRDNTYDSTWHNLYADLNKIYAYGVEKKGYKGTTNQKHIAYNNEEFDIEDGSNATNITLPYSYRYTVKYTYNPDEKVYTRYIDNEEHMSQTGDVLTAKNIIVYNVKNYDLNDGENKGRQEFETVGSGKGYYITNGKASEITWEKAGRTKKTVYKYADGTELKLNPGNTYVQIMPGKASITIE